MVLASGHQQLVWAHRRQANIVRSALRTFYPAALAGQQLEAPPVVAAAYGQVVAAAMAVIASLSGQLASLEAALTSAFGAHRDAEIVRSQPGLGLVLARAVGNRRLSTACHLWAFAALTAHPGLAAIRRPSGSRRHPSSGAAGLGEPSGRDPAWLPAPPPAL